MPLFLATGVARPGILLNAEIVGRPESVGEHVFTGFAENDVRRTFFAPAARNGEEDFGEILDEKLLLLGREHEVAVAFRDMSQRGENVATNAEIGGAEMGPLLGIGKAECYALEVIRGHVALS
jgi:hypothetical protein